MNATCIEREHPKRVMGGYEFCTAPFCGFFCVVYRQQDAPVNHEEADEAQNEANWLAFNTPRAY